MMESLENNKFFIALTTTFKKHYQSVIANCYHICIPRNGSYNPEQIDDKFVTSHILKPSPLLKAHFLPCNNKQNFNVQIDNNFIRVTKGFGDQNVTLIRILNEEKAYNRNNKSYSIFLCESPLISALNCKLNYESSQSSHDIQLVSFDDSRGFLSEISRSELDSLRCNITHLLKTYIILPDYIDDASMRLKKIVDQAIESFSRYYGKAGARYRRNNELLGSMIESFSIGLIYDQLMNPIKKKLAKQDEEFVRRTKRIKADDLKPTSFGAQKAFELFLIPDELISLLSEIDSKVTPLEKVNCMRQTLDAINDCLKKTVDEHKSPLEKCRESVCIMSDDLIAAVICVLARCELPHFCANIEFIHSFSWYLPQNSELGYSLVTFEVAKEYIRNHIDNQSSSGENGKMSYGINQVTYTQSLGNSSSNQSFRHREFSHFDNEIEKITKMLEKSDFQVDAAIPSSNSGNTKKEELGGFLGSLAGDFLTMSGQKY